MPNQLLNLKWELGYGLPVWADQGKWTSARVPGAVQLDVAEAEGYGPWPTAASNNLISYNGELNSDRFTLELEVEGQAEYDSSYLFLYRPSA